MSILGVPITSLEVSVALNIVLFYLVVVIGLKSKIKSDRIERAYLLMKSQSERDFSEYNYKRASGLDLAMTLLEGEFKWLRPW